MIEKRIDKDNLINKLHDYLKQEVMDLSAEIESQESQLKTINAEKNQLIEEESKQNDVYQIRRVFSPLSFDDEEEKTEIHVDTSSFDEQIKKIEKNLKQKSEKKHMITEYLASLEENYFILDVQPEGNEEQIPFFPAIYQLLDHVKMIHPELRIDYEKKDETSKVMMSFSFLKGFEICFKYFLYHIGVMSVRVDMFTDKNRVMIQLRGKPKFMDDISWFMNQRAQLEELLPPQFSVIKWKTSVMMAEVFIDA